LRAVATEAGQRGVKAVATLFLLSYRNVEHEHRDKRIVEEAYPDLFGHRLA
jgi:N-methylhydantoinase A/oxoprolinase/acetone carboxylase beta subunit